VPTRVTRATRAGPQPCAAAWLGYQASNLENSRTRAGRVCQFPHIPSVRAAGVEPARAHAHQVLSLARLPVTPRPRAPPGNRTPFPPIKSRVLHLYSSRRSRILTWKARTLAIVLVRHSDSGCDRTTGLLGFNQALMPTELYSCQSGWQDSNLRFPDPKSGALPSWNTSRMRAPTRRGPPGSRTRNPPVCKTGALPIGASSPWPANLTAPVRMARLVGRAALALPRLHFALWNSQVTITFPPKSGDPQGREEIEHHPRAFCPPLRPADYIPVEMRNRPPGGPGDGALRIRVIAST
jgi:hypothetical protein